MEAAIFVAGAAVAFLAWAMLFSGLHWQATIAGTVLVVGVAMVVSRAGRGRGRVAAPGSNDAMARMPHEARRRRPSDPCFITDARGRLRYANRAAAVLGAIQPGDPLSFRLRTPSFLEALDRVANRRCDRAHRLGREGADRSLVRGAHRADPHSGRAPDGSGGPDFVLVMVRYLTEQRRVEKLRVDFVANASHELRTPLAP